MDEKLKSIIETFNKNHNSVKCKIESYAMHPQLRRIVMENLSKGTCIAAPIMVDENELLMVDDETVITTILNDLYSQLMKG